MSSGTPTTRAAFFERRPARAIALQQRDWNVLRALARWRFMRASQILRYVGGSEDTGKRRLRELFDARLIARPTRQRALCADDPTPDGIYALTRRGARLVAHRDGLDLALLDHVSKNERVGAEFIHHAIGLCDVVMDFHLSAAAHGVTEVREQRELLAAMPEATRVARHPFLWRAAQVPYGRDRHDINLDPDRLLSLVVGEGRHNLVVELDRTVTIRPQAANFRRNTNAWKLAGYLHGFRAGVHTSLWGFERCRVLFVTTTEARAQKLASLAREITENALPGFFLFTAIDKVREQGVYAPIWINQRGEQLSLLR